MMYCIVAVVWIVFLVALYFYTESAVMTKVSVSGNNNLKSNFFISKHSYSNDGSACELSNADNSGEFNENALPDFDDSDYMFAVQDVNDSIDEFEKHNDPNAKDDFVNNLSPAELRHTVEFLKNKKLKEADCKEVNNVKSTVKKLHDTEVMKTLSKIKELNENILLFKELIGKEVAE